MVEEIWKVIEDSDGHYFISNLGCMKRDDYICYDAKGRKLRRKAKYWRNNRIKKEKNIFHIRRIIKKMGTILIDIEG